jgi:putative membrane protein
MYWGNYGAGTWFGWIFMVFFGVLIVLVVFFLLREMIKKERDLGQKEAPLDILKKRYAKGEISKEEFEEIKNDIMKS